MYSHDANGNVTHDGLAGLDLQYNLLNLTKRISSGGTTLADYHYLADGTRAAAKAIVNAVGSGAGSVTEQVINQEEISGAKTAISAGVGAISSAGGNGIGEVGKKRVMDKVASSSFKEEQKAIARQDLKAKEKRPSNSTVNRVSNNAIKNIEQNEKKSIETVKTSYDYSAGLYVNGKTTNYLYDRVQK